MATKSLLGYNSYPLPVGTVIYHGSDSVPDTFLKCDGASIEKSIYSVLYSVLGDSFGSVDADHFNLPDLITVPFLAGSATVNPAPVPPLVPVGATLVNQATIPALPANHFAFQSWDLTASINGNQWFPTSATSKLVGGTITNAVKADSSDVTTYSGSVTDGEIGYNNPAQEEIQPIVASGEFEPASVTFVPIIKAWYSFVSPVPVVDVPFTPPFIQTPIANTEYTTNPTGIYLNDPVLSGFIF
jgi:microcystin-dependent protein